MEVKEEILGSDIATKEEAQGGKEEYFEEAGEADDFEEEEIF